MSERFYFWKEWYRVPSGSPNEPVLVTCPKCGAKVPVLQYKAEAQCQYCGTVLSLSQPVGAQLEWPFFWAGFLLAAIIFTSFGRDISKTLITAGVEKATGK